MASTATATATSGGDAAAATMVATVDDWDSDVAMSHMFAAFRSARGVDPDDWDARMAFWRRAIAAVVRARACSPEAPPAVARLAAQSCLSLPLDTLPQRFVRRGRQPAGLAEVLHAMREQGDLLAVGDFTAQHSLLARSHRALVASPMSALRRAMGWGSKGAGAGGDWHVVVPLVQAAAEGALRRALARAREAGRLHRATTTLSALREDEGLSEHDAELVLYEMRRRGWAATQTVPLSAAQAGAGSEVVIGFAESAESTAEPLSSADVARAVCERTAGLLERRIATLEGAAGRHRAAARSRVERAERGAALHELGMARVAEKEVDRVRSALRNVQSVGLTLESASTNEAVMATMSLARDALAEAARGASAEDAGALMDDLSEHAAAQDEIGAVLAAPGVDQESDEDLVRELDRLVLDGGEPESTLADALPAPPNAEPGQSDRSKEAAPVARSLAPAS